ncbi:hypothetical protein PENTCL1PPCAC_8688, partial [Pristionchus entomophagus]
ALWLDEINCIVRGHFALLESPLGDRSEFCGFVCVVNEESSKKYDLLVENADSFLKKLPWGKAYERQVHKA